MINKKIIGIIPARYNSTRLPGKPLVNLLDKPMIYHVWLAASQSKLLSKVIVVTDDKRIQQACSDFGSECIITPGNIKSGSDRILHIMPTLNEHFDYILNIQGDEPLITADLIDELILKTIDTKADVGTLVKKIDRIEELFNSNIVKVVLRNDNTAMYFSRSPIPFNRNEESTRWLNSGRYFKHIGIYCYEHQALLKFGNLEQSTLEQTEMLEQLRLMQIGAKYICLETNMELQGVDTEEDLAKAAELLKKRLS